MKLPLWLVKAGIVSFGYAAAVLVAVATTVSLVLVPTVLPDAGALGSFYAHLKTLPLVSYFAVAVTVPTALPGFLATVGLAAMFRWQAWLAFALAGAIDVIPSQIILGLYVGASIVPPEYILASFPGGFAGGFAYWAVAARFLAKLRDNPSQSP